jgi:hypothetical protein
MRAHVNFNVMIPLFAPVMRDLQERYGLQSYSGFVYGRDGRADMKECGLETSGVRVFSEFLEQFGEREAADMDYLRQKEREYGTPTLYTLIASCRFLSTFEHGRALRLLEAGFRLIEATYDDVRPDFVLSDGVGCTMSYIQYVVAQRRGIPFLAVSSARITNRFYISRSAIDKYERMEALFAQYKRQGLPADRRAHAERFLGEFRATKAKPQYYVQYTNPPALNLHALRELGRLVHRYYIHDRRNYILMSPWQAMRGRVVRLVKARLLDPRYFDEPRDGERSIFFPLHYQPEASTLIWAPFHVDQIAAIENIAKTLPIDHVLYVKEHKGSLGRRPFGYYKRLRQIPNVRLITPYWDSHDLIRRASAVCVLTSTVGWEAIMYEKPVIALGDAFFNAYDHVARIRSYEDLAAAFHKAVTAYQPDRELLLTFIAANLEGTYEGNADYLPGMTSRAVDRARITPITDALAAELALSPRQAVSAQEAGGVSARYSAVEASRR